MFGLREPASCNTWLGRREEGGLSLFAMPQPGLRLSSSFRLSMASDLEDSLYYVPLCAASSGSITSNGKNMENVRDGKNHAFEVQ